MDDEIVAARTALIPWRGVLLTGAIAALGSVALILLQIVVFALHRPPATAAEFVDLMTRNPMLGLVSLDLIYSVNNVLVALVAQVASLRSAASTLDALLAEQGVGVDEVVADFTSARRIR